MLIRKFKQIIQNQSGISLIEFIVGMAIMLIIMAPVSNTLSAAIKSYQYNIAQNINVTSARLSLNAIEDELRYATAFTISNSGTIDYTVGAQNRKMYIGSGNNAKTLIIEHDGTINRKIAAKTVQTINFQQQDTNKINITLQINDNSYIKSPELSLTNITIVLQNIKRN